MKTLNKILTTALFASITFAGTAQADNSLSSLIYEESSNIYSEVNHQSSTPTGIISYSDDANKNSVWSSEYEQYVNPTDFQQANIANVSDVNEYMGSNPAAAKRMNGRETFTYNEIAGEYHLQ